MTPRSKDTTPTPDLSQSAPPALLLARLSAAEDAMHAAGRLALLPADIVAVFGLSGLPELLDVILAGLPGRWTTGADDVSGWRTMPDALRSWLQERAAAVAERLAAAGPDDDDDDASPVPYPPPTDGQTMAAEDLAEVFGVDVAVVESWWADGLIPGPCDDGEDLDLVELHDWAQAASMANLDGGARA